MRGSGSQARIVNMSLSACARPVTLMPGPAACPSTTLASNVIYIAIVTFSFTWKPLVTFHTRSIVIIKVSKENCIQNARYNLAFSCTEYI